MAWKPQVHLPSNATLKHPGGNTPPSRMSRHPHSARTHHPHTHTSSNAPLRSWRELVLPHPAPNTVCSTHSRLPCIGIFHHGRFSPSSSSPPRNLHSTAVQRAKLHLSDPVGPHTATPCFLNAHWLPSGTDRPLAATSGASFDLAHPRPLKAGLVHPTTESTLLFPASLSRGESRRPSNPDCSHRGPGDHAFARREFA